jgi:hypothetical protein
MKKSLILFELIVSIVLLSIIFLTTSKILLEVNKKNKTDFTTNLTKLEFETTKLFLTNVLYENKNLNDISYKETKIFFNSYLLQNNVTNFNIQQNNNIYTIDICINLYNNICQTWILKL